MAPLSKIDPATLQAYLETDYRVFSEPPAILRVGAVCANLALLHARYHVASSAFITAYNPQGHPLDAKANQARQDGLADELVRRGLSVLPAIGQHPRGGWPAEPSFLVLGVTREMAQELGHWHEQNAVVWSAGDAVPQLLLLR